MGIDRRVTVFDSAARAVAAERELQAAARADYLLWTSRTPALVAPARLMRLPEYAQAAADSAARGWPVHVRSSGGGIVPQGPGILNLTMVWRRGRGATIEQAYRILCGPIRESLQRLGLTASVGALPGAFCDGAFNVLVAGRKIAGTAQRWAAAPGGPVVLAHAVILVSPRLATAVGAVDRLLRELGSSDRVNTAAHTSLVDCVGTSALDTRAYASVLEPCVQRVLGEIYDDRAVAAR